MSARGRLVTGVATGVLLLGLAASSAVDVPWHEAATAELRLSWTARPERIDRCRVLTESELVDVPVHMRRAVECDGQAATYVLTVRVDGRSVDSAVVRGSGARHDRPIFLLRRYPIEPGRHRVEVRMRRREAVDIEGDTMPTDRSRLPRDLPLDTLVTARAGAVVLVHYDGGRLGARDR
jgi:hypothetical protein